MSLDCQNRLSLDAHVVKSGIYLSYQRDFFLVQLNKFNHIAGGIKT